MANAVAYYRVSTDRQGRSGLGLEATDAQYVGSRYPTLLFCDPKFWQALGKARMLTAQHDKWFASIPCPDRKPGCIVSHYAPRWKENWHRFIDHLADGKDADSFFASLVR